MLSLRVSIVIRTSYGTSLNACTSSTATTAVPTALVSLSVCLLMAIVVDVFLQLYTTNPFNCYAIQWFEHQAPTPLAAACADEVNRKRAK